MAKKNEQYGRYDQDSVSIVPDRFVCQICTRVLRSPHLAVCCGQHFCDSCLDKWFTRQGKEICPHRRAEGEALHHVIHKGLRSEINQLKIRCSNHGEGCQWTGELGELETHLESDKGCGYVIVACSNKCRELIQTIVSDHEHSHLMTKEVTCTMKCKDLDEHLTNFCYLRPYQCEFCGLEDAYEEITGQDLYERSSSVMKNPYGGHQAECPEAPLTCPNKCRSEKIRRKDMESHRSRCPQEAIECPFTEAGCKEKPNRCQLDAHVTTNQQQHLLLVMKSYNETKKELSETKQKLSSTRGELIAVKGTLTTAIQLLSQGKEADKEMIDFLITCPKRLMNCGSSVDIVMPKFSVYRCSGKVWHSPPFIYEEHYKMSLAVYANGVGSGAGSHISVSLFILGRTKQNKSVTYEEYHCKEVAMLPEGQQWFRVCLYQLQIRSTLEEKKMLVPCTYPNELWRVDRFCPLRSGALCFVKDCLTFNVKYADSCHFLIKLI